jgi:glyoxylase-like metal-dependent hydrolase (beta-lactamase superfamily II)
MIRRRILFSMTLAAPALLRAAPGLAQAPSAPAPVFHRTRLGALEVTVLNDGTGSRGDVTQGGVQNAPAEEIARVLAAQGIAGTVLANSWNPTLVRGPAGTVLLDTGRGGANGRLQASLRAAGVEPAEVTLVVITHFHGDHIGGLVGADGTAAYPNARLLVPARELAFWTDAGEEARASEGRRPGFALTRRNLAPYADRTATFEDGAALAPGLTAVATNGHSPGHSSILIADGAAQLMVIGDAVTAPELFVPMPDWAPAQDMDPAMAARTRRALLDRLATDRIPVIGYHWPMPAVARIERAGTGFRKLPAEA